MEQYVVTSCEYGISCSNLHSLVITCNFNKFLPQLVSTFFKMFLLFGKRDKICLRLWLHRSLDIAAKVSDFPFNFGSPAFICLFLIKITSPWVGNSPNCCANAIYWNKRFSIQLPFEIETVVCVCQGKLAENGLVCVKLTKI